MKEDSLLVALTSAHKVVALTRPHDNFRFVSKTFNNFVKGGTCFSIVWLRKITSIPKLV